MDEDIGLPEPTGDSPSPGDPADSSEVTDPARREFMKRSIAAIGGGITVAVGVPSALFVAGSLRSVGGDTEWVRLGSVSSVQPGAAPTLMKAVITRRSGYLVEEEEVSVFVTTDDGSEFTVLSNICTHLACRVRWVEDEDGFFCPCHNAVFGRDGDVVRGPPPRPLDRFDWMVEEGQLFFREA